nr:hypothetical protein GCM10020092_056240 [Actinoplanes digitatis]
MPKTFVSNVSRITSAVTSAAPITTLLASISRWIAGVVDEHVQPAVGLDGLGRGRDGRVVGDVEPHRPGPQQFGGPASPLGVPASDVDAMTRGDEPAGGLEAEALVRSGDQSRGHGNRH